jgi:hypothetical protein
VLAACACRSIGPLLLYANEERVAELDLLLIHFAGFGGTFERIDVLARLDVQDKI